MKKANYIKFVLDIILGITFALFYNKNVLGGLQFHEIAGLTICGGILVHVLLNWKWVKNVSLKLFDRKLPNKTRLSYLLNLLLLITMTTVVITGIFISRVVFPNINIGNEQSFKMLHLTVSYLTLIIVAVHVGLHWQWVMNLFKKIFNIKSSSKVMGYTAKVATVMMLLFGGYEIYSTGFVTKVAQSGNIFSASSQQGKMGGEGFGQRQFGENGQPPQGFDGERPTPPSGDLDNNGESSVPPNGDFQGNGNNSSNQSDGSQGNGSTVANQSGDFQGNGNFPARPDGDFKGEHGGSSNPIGVIAEYFGIMSVFIILTYYLGKIKPKSKSNIV
ncbi:MAG: hypothetical protein K0Q87_3090 [Neobacillus sp.]|nr:hypothetical protein [Neobacillus sp.]